MSMAPQFKTFPTQDQLAHMDRDLTFHPSTVQNPRVLTPAQIAHFNREGYINGIRVFSPEEIAGTRAFVDGIIGRVLAQGGSSYSVKHAHEANNSRRRRCGLTLRYCTPDVRGTLGWNNEGVLISGGDPEGHWGNPPRPARDYEGI